MGKFTKVVSKNLKLLMRAKRSAFIVIVGPLLVMLLVGLAFNNSSTYSITTGVYSSSFSNTSNMFVDEMAKKFNTVRYDNFEKCVNDVKQRYTHACIVFPPDMEIKNGVTNEVKFYLDESNINLAWMVSKSVSDISIGKSSELSMDMTNILLSRIDMTKAFLTNNSENINNLLQSNNQLSSSTSSIKSTAGSIQSEDLKSLAKNVESLKSTASDLTSSYDALITKIKTEANKLPVEAAEGKAAILALANSASSNLTTMKSKVSSLDVSNANSLVDSVSRSQNEILSTSDSISSDISSSLNLLSSMKSSTSTLNTSITGIQVTSASSIVSPITTKIEPIAAESTHLNYMLPGLLVLLVMFVSILLSCSIVIREKTSSAFFRNFTAPIRNITFIAGNFVSAVIILIMQLIIILLVAKFVFAINIVNNIWLTMLILMLLVIVFVLLGMLIGILFNREETAMLAAISISAVFLFLSNLILPMESMPIYIKKIAEFNPFVIGESLIKKSMMFGIDLYSLSNQLYILLAYIAGIFILMLLLHHVMNMRFFNWSASRAMRNRDKEKLERRMASAFDTIKPDQYFKMDDGTIIKTMKDMVEALEYMDDKTFRRYSNREKNDFANWAKYVLKNSMLARELSKIKTRQELIVKLKDEPKPKKGFLGLFNKKEKLEKLEKQQREERKEKRKPEKKGMELAEEMAKKK